MAYNNNINRTPLMITDVTHDPEEWYKFWYESEASDEHNKTEFTYPENDKNKIVC